MSANTESQNPFPTRLKQARRQTGLSQKALGILAGIDEFSASSRMNHYEQGKHAPDFEMAKRLANQLTVPTSYFYEEDDDIANMLTLYAKLNAKDKQIITEKIVALTNSEAL